MSVEHNALCTVDTCGSIVRETKAAREAPVIAETPRAYRGELALAALVAGAAVAAPEFDGLAGAGYPIGPCAPRDAARFLEAWNGKTDRNDARSLASTARGPASEGPRRDARRPGGPGAADHRAKGRSGLPRHLPRAVVRADRRRARLARIRIATKVSRPFAAEDVRQEADIGSRRRAGTASGSPLKKSTR